MNSSSPVLEEQKKVIKSHNHRRQDDYYWVMHKNKRRKVIKHLEKENEYCDKTMKNTEKLQDTLYKEFKSRTKENYTSVPAFYKGYYYYSIIKKGENYRRYYRKEKLKGSSTLILDCMRLSKGKEFFDVGSHEISPDSVSIAYCIDTNGDEKYEFYIKNIETGKVKRELKKQIEPDFSWGIDSTEIFYITVDKSKRPYRVWKHIVGTNEKDDLLLYEEMDNKFTVDISKSYDEKYIFIDINSSTTTEVYCVKHDNIYLIDKRTKGHIYTIDHHNDSFYILTNTNKSTNFKIVKTSICSTGKQKWKNFIKYDSSVYILGFIIFKNYIVLQCKIDGEHAIKIYNINNPSDLKVIKRGDVSDLEIVDNLNLDYNSDKLVYSFSSLTTPVIIYEYDMKTSKQIVLKKTVFKGYNPNLYECKRLNINNKGLYLSIVYKKSKFKKDGTNGGYLYGYGSYGEIVDVNFDKYIISLLDRGFIHAIGHVRGSGYLGRDWYYAGRLTKKKNTFNDFIECGKYLIKNKYVSSDKLSIGGGSAGGLLVGATINKNPKLFRTAILEVPFVDCLTTMLNSKLPLTTGEYEEWGNPEKFKSIYKYMLSYSPIDNIKNKNYPNILITTSVNDTRVGFWEPVKYCAKLRKEVDIFKKNRCLMMKVDLCSGHSGTSERYKYMLEEAFKYAFLIKYTS